MTTQQLYQKVINEQMSHEEFLWNVRRDTRVNGILTNTMSYEDTVGVLKSKGYIWENVQGEEVAKMDFLGSFKTLNEENKLKGGKGDKLTADQVNYHEFTKGWKHELEHTDDIEKAKEIALDHLAEDPNYYTRLDMIEYQAKKAKKEAAPKEVSKTNLKDKENQMTSPKGVKKEKTNVGRKKEKAKKVTGVKTMKGGSEAPKTIKEAVDKTMKYNPDQLYLWRYKDGNNDNYGNLDQEEFDTIMSASIGENPKVTDFYKISQKDIEDRQAKKLPIKKAEPEDKKVPISTKGVKAPSIKAPAGETKSYELKLDPKDPSKTATVSLTDKEADKRREQWKTKGGEGDPLTPVKSGLSLGSKYGKTPMEKPIPGDEMKKSVATKKDGKSLFLGDKPSEGRPYLVIDKSAKDLASLIINSYKTKDEADAATEEGIKQRKNYKTIQKIALPSFIKSLGVTNEELNKADEKAMKSEGIKDKSSSSDDVNKEVQFTIHTDYVLNDENGDIPKDSSGKPVKNIGFLSADSAEKRKSELEKQGIKTKLVRDIDQLSNMTAKVKSVKFDKTKERLTIKLDNGADVIFVKTTNGKVKGIYTIGRDHANISSTGKQLDAMINKAFGKADPQQQPAEEPMNEALVNYIRQRIRKILKEGYNEEGQYPGVAGPDVVKKKLHHIMQTYDWGFQDSKDPFVRDNGNQKNSLATKLIFDLGPDGEGIIIFNSYAPKGFEISSIDDLGGYTGAVNGGMPQDREFNPDKLTARGGRVAEAADEDIKNEECKKKVKKLQDRFVYEANKYNRILDHEKKEMLPNIYKKMKLDFDELKGITKYLNSEDQASMSIILKNIYTIPDDIIKNFDKIVGLDKIDYDNEINKQTNNDCGKEIERFEGLIEYAENTLKKLKLAIENKIKPILRNKLKDELEKIVSISKNVDAEHKDIWVDVVKGIDDSMNIYIKEDYKEDQQKKLDYMTGMNIQDLIKKYINNEFVGMKRLAAIKIIQNTLRVGDIKKSLPTGTKLIDLINALKADKEIK